MKQVLITVGTTNFDDLISSWDSNVAFEWLKFHNFDSIVFQIGTGSYIPSVLHDLSILPSNSNKIKKIDVSWFRLVPDLSSIMDQSTLIVSHAGAGTVIEALEKGKSLIVTVNRSLMDDHQAELAEALQESQLCTILPFPLTNETLQQVILNDDSSSSISNTINSDQENIFPTLMDKWR